MYLYIWMHYEYINKGASLVDQTVKNPPAMFETQVRVGKILWRRKWQPTRVFLPGESRGQRSLVSYSPCGLKELDTTDQLSMQACMYRKMAKS